MASWKFHTQNVVLSLSLTLTLVLVLLTSKANSAETVSFSWDKFAPEQPNLILQGDALVTSSGKLQLTKVDENGTPKPKSLGRALYSTPIHIWDKETGSVASFAASFNFTVYAPDTEMLADGLAFFLAPIDTKPQTRGGYLGLYNSHDNNNNESGDQVVAVEFDTYQNTWDPPNPHIGINVNSIRSTQTTSWDLANNKVAKVLVTYDASTNLLVASLVHPSQRTSYILSDVVDLKTALPEWVRIGFSATTGLNVAAETHDVLSWSFASNLPQASSNIDPLDLTSFVLHEAI